MSVVTTQNHLPGFVDPVHDAQRVFRAVLEAMARPTLAQPILAASPLQTPAPLGAVAGAVVLALCDEQTPIWLDRALANAGEVCAWIRFHTGARLVERPGDALFAVASSPSAAPRLAELAQGTDEEPHLSATLVIDAVGAKPIGAFTATGPGVNGEASWDGAGLPGGFLAQWEANRAGFPRGVDVILAGANEVRALPRTTTLTGRENRSA
ncbi:phosphonate C-P lyase system protein PhnH [Microbacterium paludicola]|uniref:Phosphonate C-P lyase system protein PhnH n=1 Tax=Microbacterium paludicola TaxID=300019 RepID=A0A4Y9FXH9_9MICO|nr:phosphonate C-P lyase system protein PhnH [Microbacterium paludicola]MBF0815232.1 phosphonate C-P lyase system protein PhnH [Microbacterium paludicola]TFU34108.1 phosphonate C-P lyase system protein PhnH [Microbacterium paludicola]